MLRNTANQKWRVFAFSRESGTPVTGDAANITAKISGDHGALEPIADTNPTETEDGYYVFDLTQSETNHYHIDIYPESSTVDVQVIGVPGSENTESQATGQKTYTFTTTPLASVYITTDEAGTTRAESHEGTYRANQDGTVTFDIEPGTYYLWVSRAGFTFTNPYQITVV